MHIKSKPPVFVPAEHRAEIEALSKAALMDIAWDYACACSGAFDTDPAAAMANFRERRDVILIYRARS